MTSFLRMSDNNLCGEVNRLPNLALKASDFKAQNLTAYSTISQVRQLADSYRTFYENFQRNPIWQNKLGPVFRKTKEFAHFK